MECLINQFQQKEKHPDFNESRCFLLVEAMGVEQLNLILLRQK